MCRKLICLLSLFLLLSLTSTTYAIVVGDFEGSLDGWLPAGDSTLSLSTIGATTGTGSMLIDGPGSWQMHALLDIKSLRYVLGVDDAAISIDVTAFAEDMETDWMNMEAIINGQNHDETGAHNNIGWQSLGGLDIVRDGVPQTLYWEVPDDLSAKIAGTDDNIEWFELFIVTNNGATNTKIYVDNIQLIGAEPEPEPEPSRILKLDINNTNTPEETEPGFTSFTLADSGSEVDGITIEFGGYNAGDSRRRGEPAGVPFENIYRDFIFGRQAEAGVGLVTVTLSGLKANQTYGITIYSWDTNSTGLRVTDWTANGEFLLTTMHDGSVNPPVAEDDYAYTGIATADANGVILMEGVPGEGTFAAEPFGFINALVLSFAAGPAKPAELVHSYTFEDGTANDSVGEAHGTLIGDASIVDGALVTTDQEQWMEMPGDVIAMNTFDEVTIEAWYTPTAGANAGWSMLAYFGDSVDGLGSNGFFITTARADDKSRAAISIGDIATPWASETGADGPEYDDGLLHHMVSTINATDITLYIDGVLIASTPLDPHNSISGISQNFAYLAKGGYDGDPEWIGSIEEFNIYNYAISLAKVEANYAAGPQKEEPVVPVDPGTEGLVAYYAFENDTNDSSGNELHGTIVGDPIFVDGQAGYGTALDFDGDGDYVDCGNSPMFDITDAITVAAWVNIRGIAGDWRAVIAKGDNAWRISNYESSQRMHFAFEDGSRGWQAANSDSELPLNEWHHVCGTYDLQNGGRIYIDGVLDGTNPDTGGITLDTYNLYIGNNSQNPDRYWDGLIDEVMIYNRALSAGEVAYLAGQ